MKNRILLCASIVLLWEHLVFGQVDFLKRYYRDEPVARVETALRRLEEVGRREGDRLYLTEREAIALALENNLQVNVERHTRLVRLWEEELRKAVYDPAGIFGLNWSRQKTPTASVLQGGPSVTDILTTYNFGYRQAFPTGTALELTFLGTRNRTTNFFASLVPAIQTQIEVLFRQNLLEGFLKADAEYDLEISRNNLDLSDEQFRALLIDVVTQVQDRFWELEYALKDIEVKQKSLELAETVYRQNQDRLEVGTASRLEVVQSEAEVASRREELIRAEYYYRQVQDQLVQLLTNLRDPRQFPGRIVPEQADRPLPAELEPFEKLLKTAEELRPEVVQADLSVSNQEVELRRARDKLKPSLELVTGFQFFGLGGTQVIRDFSQGFFNPPIVAVIPGGLGDALSQTFGGDFYGYVLGFNFQIPVHNTEARARSATVQIELNRARMQRQAVLQNIGLEIRDALTQIEMNRARIEAAEAAVRSARERLEGEQARFEVGMGTTRELIEAQRDLLQAESVLVRARVDLIKSFNLLDKAVGRTLQRQRIVVEETWRKNVRLPG